MRLPEDQQRAFQDAVEIARRREDVRRAVRNVYLALQDAIDLRQPICRTSGRCCKFDEYGHRLFVTTMEFGTFLRELHDRTKARPFTGAGPICPFQIDNLCSVHDVRPFGCRIFFCDETATDWQQQQYARFHVELKRLHALLEIPYFYVEWRQAMELAYPHVNPRPLL
jgi:Fe-S-cluster containining protein